MSEELSELLGNAAPTEEPEPASAAAEGEPEGEPEKEPEAEPPADTVPKAALMSERQKRQDAERRLDALLQQQQPQPTPDKPEDAPGFWDDPEKALDHRVAKAEESMEGRLLRMSAALTRSQFPDFDEKVAVYSELERANPALGVQARASDNPALFAYETAVNHEKLQQLAEVGDVDALKAKIREDLIAEMKASETGALKDAAASTPNLNEMRSSAPSAEAPAAPSLEDLLRQ